MVCRREIHEDVCLRDGIRYTCRKLLIRNDSINDRQEAHKMAQCPSCNREVAGDARWCSMCHGHVSDPQVGRLASPGRRLGAYILDMVLALWFLTTFLPDSLVMIVFLIIAIIFFARGTTPGKRILGMWVINEDGNRSGFFTMLVRETVGKFISGLVLSLGFIWILIDRDNQGWHDKLMSTYVVQK